MSELKALEAEMLAVNIKLAKHIVPHIKEGSAAIDEDSAKFIARIEAARAQIPNPSDAYNNFTNLLEVIKHTRLYFGGEVDRLEKLIAMEAK